MARIAVVGWGSLIWDPRELPHQPPWRRGGPVLPLEFSRVSNDGRLTLVVDPARGENSPTRFVLSARRRLHEAIDDLAFREGRTTPDSIGFVDLVGDDRRSRVGDIAAPVSDWCRRQGLDGALWTDLPPTFEGATGRPFSVTAAEAYLGSLTGDIENTARAYIRNAPNEVATPLRRHLETTGWLDGG